MAYGKNLLVESSFSDIVTQINLLEGELIIIFQAEFDIKLDNDARSVKFLCDFIELYREKFENQTKEVWIDLIGAFLGQTIIKVYGGKWVDLSSLGVELQDGNICFPFRTVSNQFEFGQKNSIYCHFNFIAEIIEQKLPFC